ncbi:HPP family protein [Desulforamulus aquiferis]|uniref:HPP family protein n=1 Tax=Desulforamulus aquiferis TaxID=1397668 RepID=A0AAW7ZHE5_9FIRM|nr:HPP family protein [Desulforamulus aquiferis]MDO7789113.1 HPP family protein [Desulforamulus aquiferis]
MEKAKLAEKGSRLYTRTLVDYLIKLRGEKSQYTPINVRGVIFNSLGVFLSIGLIVFLSNLYTLPLLVPSLGATAILLYSAWDSPMSQPRNIILGHMVSATAGVVTYYFMGIQWWSIALAVSLAIVLMTLTRSLHPPGGATAFIGVYTGQSFIYIFTPVALGAIFITVISALIINISPDRKYPYYWL